MENKFKGITVHDSKRFMLVFDNIMECYKLFKKYEDRRHKKGYKWLLIGLTDRKEIVNELLENHKNIM